jgi:hypothetical protein
VTADDWIRVTNNAIGALVFGVLLLWYFGVFDREGGE